MNNLSSYENDQNHVVDEETYSMQYICSRTEYLHSISCKDNSDFTTTQIPKRKDIGIRMKGAGIKRSYTAHTDQDKVRFFKQMFEKVMNALTAAKKPGIHVISAQRGALQYEKDLDSIFKKHNARGRSHILDEEHKSVTLEYGDEDPPIVLEQLMERLLQRFEGLQSI